MFLKSVCFFLALLHPLFLEGNQQINPVREKQFLEAEWSLARMPHIYFVFDIQDKKIYAKIRGMTLREWEVEEVKLWGSQIPVKSFSLEKKSTFLPPKRKSIKPGKQKDGEKFEIEALEVDDMPSVYTLSLEGGIKIYLRPRKSGFFSTFLLARHFFKWYSFSPLLTLWFAIQKSPFTAIDLQLKNERESQALYWTLREESACLIFSSKNRLHQL